MGVRPALCEQLEDLELSIGQLRERLPGLGPRCGGKEALQVGGDPGAEDRFAVCDRPDRAKRFVLGRSLQEIAAGAGADGCEHGVVVVVHRHHEHVDVAAAVDDLAGRVDAVEAGHVDVHDDDVRLEGEGRVDSLIAGRCFPDDLGVGYGLQERAQAGPEEWMVVRDHDADRPGHRPVWFGKAWQQRGHERSPDSGLADLAGAAHLGGPLAHGVESKTGRRVSETDAVVLDLKAERAGLYGDANAAGAGVRVPPDVGESFLCDPVGRDLDRGRKLGQRGWSVHPDSRLGVESRVASVRSEAASPSSSSAGGRSP